ncbi:MAG: hypothetical protein ACM3XO_22370 [Bacteroidota bacterium]
MVDIEARVQKAIEEITGNEALMEMLDTEAAAEMLEWGKSMVRSLVNETAGMDDEAAELALEPRLKAVRQLIRSAGNWAAGSYTEPDDRIQLREKLLGYQKVIRGEGTPLPSAGQLDALLNSTNAAQVTPQQQILNLKKLFNEAR